MELFFDYIYKLSPLFLYLVIGYILGKKFEVSSKSVNNILIYFILPVIIFNSVFSVEISPEILVFPLIVFLIAVIFTFSTFLIFKNYYKDARANIIAFNSSAGNFGYFGLAIALSIFDDSQSDFYVLVIPTLLIFQFTIGVFIVANGKSSIQESIISILKLPLIYAVMIAVFMNIANFNMPEIYINFVNSVSGAFTILGMMIVGLSISDYKDLKFDYNFILSNLIIKFIIWPMVIVCLIYLDGILFGIISEQMRLSLLLLSILPIAAGSVVFANKFDTFPSKTAFVVTISTLISLFYVPVMVIILGL